MIKKFLALILAVSMITACGAASSQGSSSSSEQEHIPSYTYVNPDPDMVMITAPGGNITYDKYRLYLDISEQTARYTARQTMAVGAALEHDFKGMGIEIDEDEYSSIAEQQLAMSLLYSPSISEELERLATATGMTEEDAKSAMMQSFRTQYLVQLLSEHFSEEAAKEYVEPEEAPAGSSEAPEKAPASSKTPEAAPASGSEAPEAAPADSSETPEEAAARKEQAKQQAIYEAASQKMAEYSEKYETRLTFDNEGSLVTLDGSDIAYTDEAKRYMDYSAAAARFDAVSAILSGELVMRELERRGTALDTANFDASLKQYEASMRADQTYMGHMEKFCAVYGATIDDYIKSLSAAMLLEEAGMQYYNDIISEYEGLTADSGAAPQEGLAASADEHYVSSITALTKDAEIVNFMGK